MTHGAIRVLGLGQAIGLAIAVAACDAPPAERTDAPSRGTPDLPDRKSVASDRIASEGIALDEVAYDRVALERVALDTGALERSGRIALEVDANTVSLLFTAALEDETFGIGITRVLRPDGSVAHATTFEADSWEAVRFESELVAEPIVGTGDIALFVPAPTGGTLAPGTWRIELETDPADARFVHATAASRTVTDGVDLDRVPHVLDLHVHVVLADARYRGDGFADELDTDWRAALDRVLGPHGLSVGTTMRTVSSVRETARLAALDDEREIAEACRAARRAGAAAGGDAPAAADATPALHVALVRTITSEGATDYTVDDLVPDGFVPDGDIPGDVVPDRVFVDEESVDDEAENDIESEADRSEGDEALLTGLSPQPGLPFDDESPNACVFVAEGPWRENGVDGTPLDEPTVVELIAANLLHELGHFAGLAHPSEADGSTFDLLDDTPRCTSVAADSCGVAGGADNLMFHSGDETTLPWTLTPDQARVLRVHPLFRPTAAPRRPTGPTRAQPSDAPAPSASCNSPRTGTPTQSGRCSSS